MPGSRCLISLAASMLFISHAASYAAATFDFCIYGGTSAGVVAACAAKKNNKTVIIIEPGKHIGGMTTGGLSATDIGSSNAIIGMSAEFYRQVGQRYGSTQPEYFFEPKVAEQVYTAWITNYAVPVLFQHRLKSVHKNSSAAIDQATFETSGAAAPDSTINARIFIDCSYEGDLMAMAGVTFTVGRESNALYNETIDGVQLRTGHQFPDGISPYVVAGDAGSGLLPGINPNPKPADGTGDTMIQAYNYRLTMTQAAANRLPFPAPASYNASRYELLGRVCAAGSITSLGQLFSMRALRNSKYDWNNQGPVSTDYIGANYSYPRADYLARSQQWTDHKEWILGLVKFIATDSRVPQGIKNELATWGLCGDEYADNGNWPYQLYVREARRMVSDYVMTERNCRRTIVAGDGIAFGSYTMDSHNCERVVVNGMVKNEGDVQVAIGNGPYPIAYRSIIPAAAECTNLFVPVCLSASHIAYGSIRMEPVFMMLGEAAAIAGCLAIDADTTVQSVDVAALREALGLAIRGILMDSEWPDSNGHVTITGAWTTSSAIAGYNGSGYLHDENAGKGTKSVRYTPQIDTAGTYDIYVLWTADANRASNVPIAIVTAQGVTNTTVDQTANGGVWRKIGTADFRKGTIDYIEISTTGTNGYVIADAVLFVPTWITGARGPLSSAQPAKKRFSVYGKDGCLVVDWPATEAERNTGRFSLYDVRGRLVNQWRIANGQNVLPAGTLSHGIYFGRLAITGPSGRHLQKTAIIRW